MTTETYTTRRVQEITPALAIEAGLRGIELTTARWAPDYTPEYASDLVVPSAETLAKLNDPGPRIPARTQPKPVVDSRTGYEHWTSARLADAVEAASVLIGDGVTIEKYIRLATEATKRGLTVPKPVMPKSSGRVTVAKVPTSFELTEGTYKNEDQVIRVTRSREGRLYGKVWAEGSFEYRPGLLRGLTSDMLMTLDQAMAFGVQFGVCCICAKRLTKPESIDKGIGPICEGRF